MQSRCITFILILSILMPAAAVSGADWPMWRYDASRSGASSTAISTTLYLQYVLELPPLEKAWPSESRMVFDQAYEPVVAGSLMYVGSSFSDSVRAYDTETGAEQWCFYTAGAVRFAPAVGGGRVYAAADDGYLYCLNAADGSLIWKFNGAPRNSLCLGNKRLGSMWVARGGPVLAGGNVYFAAGIWPFMGTAVYSLNATTGDIVWTNERDFSTYMSTPHGGANAFSGLAPQGYLAQAGSYLIVPNGRAPAAVLDSTNGDQIRFNHDALNLHRAATSYAAITGAYYHNANRLLDLATGGESLSTLTNGAILNGSTAYTGAIEAINTPALTSKWSYGASGYEVYCTAGNYLFAGAPGNVMALQDTGSAPGAPTWTKPIVGTPVSMIAADDKLFVSCLEGYIYCFGTTNTGASLPGGGTGMLIAKGSTWKYLDDGSDQGTAWRGLAFNDSGWASGPAELGYGDGDEATVVSYGPDSGNKYITTYFRKTINVASAAAVLDMAISCKLDDGAVVYINGTEAWRQGMTGAVNYLTPGDGVNENTYYVGLPDPGLLVDGTNVIAAEVHQANGTSSDISFDLELTATIDPLGNIVWPGADSWTTEAATILATTGITEGYAVCLGADSGRLMEELVKQAGLRIIGLEPDASKVAALRARWDGMNAPREYLSVIQGTINSAQLPPYLADLIVSEDQTVSGLADGDIFVKNAFAALRPYGGQLCLTGSHAAAFNSGITAYSLANAVVGTPGGYTTLERASALPGAGQWGHQYADAGNTLFSPDTLVKPPLGLLWFGGSSNQRILPRHGHGPSELVVGGRLFIEGPDHMRALDVYTGRVIWELNLPGVGDNYNYTSHEPGANHIGSNYAAADDAIYICRGPDCLKVDPATGNIDDTFTMEGGRYFAQVKVSGGLLIVAADPVSFPNPTNVGTDNWNETCSKDIYVLDRSSGAKIWSATAVNAFHHNTIIVGNGLLYAVDRMPPGQINALSRRGQTAAEDGNQILKSWNVTTGAAGWSTSTASEFGTWLGYSAEEDILILSGRPSRDMVTGEDSGRIIAYDCANSYNVLYDKSGVNQGPYILYHDIIITQDGGGGEALDMRTGNTYTKPNPITGLSETWGFDRRYGCNTAIASENLLTFRSGAAGYYDIKGGGTGNLAGFKSGCTPNLIAADGVLNAPDYTRTCTCGYQNQTSLGLVHMPEAEMWTFEPAQAIGASPVQQIGVNFGASGDRVAENGVLWLDYPDVGSTSPPVTINTTGGLTSFRDQSADFESDSMAWVTASGVTGITSVTIDLNNSRDYHIRLFFAEPGGLTTGQRVFDVDIEGATVLSNFDVAAAAGSEGMRVVRVFSGVTVTDTLTIDLTASVGTPVLCGIEITPDTGAPAANGEPVVAAGPDEDITVAITVNLDGTVTDDGLPNPPATVTTSWTKVSGPAAVTFGNSANIDTTADFVAPGTYVLRLTADDSGAQVYDELIVRVAGSPLTASIDVPATSPLILDTGDGSLVNFTGSASGGTPGYVYLWDHDYSGAFIADTGNTTTTSNNYNCGVYTAALQVTDSAPVSDLDTIVIMVFDDGGTPGNYGDDSDWDADGLPDGWEIFYFNDFDETGAGNPDGDGGDNATEFAGGTDPTVADAALSASIDAPASDPLVITTGNASTVNFTGSASGGFPAYTHLWDYEYSGAFVADTGNTTTGSYDYNNGTYTAAFQVTDAAPVTVLDSMTIMVFDDGGTPGTYGDDSDWDADGLPDGWEIFHFNDFDEVGAGNPDADGADNAAEWAGGTDPNINDVTVPGPTSSGTKGGCGAASGGLLTGLLIFALGAINRRKDR